MFRDPSGQLRYSPSDLVAFLEGDFAAWCERAYLEGRGGAAGTGPAPDEDPERALAARRGQEFESRHLSSFRVAHPDLVEIARGPEAVTQTLAAMGSGRGAIYQAQLSDGAWSGYPDFLLRSAGPSRLGDYHYLPWDTKLARSARPYFLVQLAAYAELLEQAQGRRPGELGFVLGHGEVLRFPTEQCFYFYRELKRAFLEFQAGWRADRPPDPGLDRSFGRWTGAAAAWFDQSDHLSRVANITRGQVRRLEDAGITTLAGLAGSTRDRVARMTPAVLERLRQQARLQIASRGAPRPHWQLRPTDPEDPGRGLALLPPPSPNDVFFDLEGFPFAEGGLEYLFGAVTVDAREPGFHDWWAHDGAGERLAFERFMDWVVARWRQDPGMHIYHYATYEPATLKRLMGKYATREREVDDLLRHGVFVDLYTVVRQGLLVGTPSYSLKEVERLYRPPREGDVTTAGGSVLEYQRWLDSGEPAEWGRSPILSGIRDYNRVDCQSTWELREWLLERQREAGIGYHPPRSTAVAEAEAAPARDPSPAERVAARLLALAAVEPDAERARVTQLLGWLVEFHRREEKPMWWRMFERLAMTEEELAADGDCLAGLERTGTPARPVKRSWAHEYRFDPGQDTKLREEKECLIAGTDLKCEIFEFDGERGLLTIKVGPGRSLPERMSLIPYEHVSAEPIKGAILRLAEAWADGQVASSAVADLLHRRPPRITGHAGGPLVGPGDFLPQAADIVSRMAGTTLSIQGPPGTGKTYTAARVITELLRRGKRVGVTATSHKVIFNLLRAVVEARQETPAPGAIYKVGNEADPLLEAGVVRGIEANAVAGVLGGGPVLVGGTAWVFSRPELAGRFDYLLIDEAGQVALANAVAMGLAATNLVLIGDQMQLGQPMQGTHPGESGRSCLEYLLQDRATVPPELGMFLGTSHRMHPAVCGFISAAIYDGRLGSAEAASRHQVLPGAEGGLVPETRGIRWVPVAHEGCTQSSEEEVDVIARLVQELLAREVVDRSGRTRPMTLEDILLVAPFNMQVRQLRDRLGAGARVGSVDKFQGQEAPVVIVSMCASTLEEAPRGAEFLLSPNRLNVAVSRAEALAIVVGSPGLLSARPRTVAEVRLLNLLCRLAQYGGRALPATA